MLRPACLHQQTLYALAQITFLQPVRSFNLGISSLSSTSYSTYGKASFGSYPKAEVTMISWFPIRVTDVKGIYYISFCFALFSFSARLVLLNTLSVCAVPTQSVDGADCESGKRRHIILECSPIGWLEVCPSRPGGVSVDVSAGR